MRKRTITAAVITGTTVLAGVVAVGGTASASQSTQAIARTKPAWTTHAKRLGRVEENRSVTARVYLQPKGGLASVAQFATAASTPGSAAYHKFLTSAQYYARFGTTDATASSVASYLRSSGLTVTGTAAHNRYLTVRGTAAHAEHAFGTPLERFSYRGKNVQAPTSNVSLPSTVARNVLTVTGLSTATNQVTPASLEKSQALPAGFRNAHPCSKYFGQITAKYQADYKTALPMFQGTYLPYAVCGYTGPQLRSAYEGDTTLDGSGVTVAITDAYASPTIAKDADTYATNHGDGSYTDGQLSQFTPDQYTHQKACDPSGWYGEETLDVEAVHAMAPAANIDYYASSSCNDSDFIDTLAKVVSDDKAQIVSNSWAGVEEGESADSVNAYEQVFLQGAAEGISFTFSSGDDGDELNASGLKQVNYPSSDPYVTGVGGTSTGIGANGTITLDTGWSTDKYALSKDQKSWSPLGYLYGAGGGVSSLFNQPSYQASVTNNAYRQVPDVAMDADPTTGMLIGETQQFSTGRQYDEYRIGGTSLASPLFAGLTALAIQNGGGKGVGLLNPIIYKNASTDFTDIKGTPKVAGNVRVDFANGENASNGLVYSVRTFDATDSGIKINKGYDQITGVGVPNTKWLSALGGTS